jgi:hypothetical protein
VKPEVKHELSQKAREQTVQEKAAWAEEQRKNQASERRERDAEKVRMDRERELSDENIAAEFVNTAGSIEQAEIRRKMVADQKKQQSKAQGEAKEEKPMPLIFRIV